MKIYLKYENKTMVISLCLWRNSSRELSNNLGPILKWKIDFSFDYYYTNEIDLI